MCWPPKAIAHLAARQVAAHAGRRFQPESAPAGQQNAVHLIGDVAGTEGVDLLRAAGAAAYVHASHGALLAQDGGASGDRVKVREVPDANSRDVGKSFHN